MELTACIGAILFSLAKNFGPISACMICACKQSSVSFPGLLFSPLFFTWILFPPLSLHRFSFFFLCPPFPFSRRIPWPHTFHFLLKIILCISLTKKAVGHVYFNFVLIFCFLVIILIPVLNYIMTESTQQDKIDTNLKLCLELFKSEACPVSFSKLWCCQEILLVLVSIFCLSFFPLFPKLV